MTNGTWNQVAKLTTNDDESEDVFGNGMALLANGATALISAIGKNNHQGAAYVFTTTNGWVTHTQTAEPTANNGMPGDRFSYDVALSEDGATALIGSVGANVGANVGQGAAYVFKKSGGTWPKRPNSPKAMVPKVTPSPPLLPFPVTGKRH